MHYDMVELRQNKLKIVGVGAGGHCRVILDIIEKLDRYEVVGLTDQDEQLEGELLEGVRIIGQDDQLEVLRAGGVGYAFLGLGSVGDHRLRKKIYTSLINEGFSLPSLLHPKAVIARSVQIGNACQIMAGVVINPNVKIGNNTIINTSSVVEHDCQIADHVHVAPGVIMGGGVCIAEGAHVGIGATIREGIKLGKGSMVGAGSLVVKDVLSGETVMGVPAKAYEKHKESKNE